jgi:L-ascorbate metabolism protein UlaG (beta-lactamase superfamily)
MTKRLSRFTLGTAAAILALLFAAGCGDDGGNGDGVDGTVDAGVDSSTPADATVDGASPDGGTATGLTLTFIDNNQFILEFGGSVVYTDVCLDVPPGSPDPDIIKISHDHFDHFNPTVVADIANRTGAIVVAPAQATAQLAGLVPPAQIVEMSPANGGREGPTMVAGVSVTTYGESFSGGHGWSHVLEAGGLRLFDAGCSAWDDFVQLSGSYPELYQLNVALLAWYDRAQFVQAVHPDLTVMMHFSGYCEVYVGDSATPVNVASGSSYEF